MTLLIRLCINSCCSCRIFMLASMGVSWLLLSWLWSYSIWGTRSGSDENSFFMWVSICNWMVRCCSGEGCIICGMFFIMCACIFIAILCCS